MDHGFCDRGLWPVLCAQPAGERGDLVEAGVHGDRGSALQALLLDPVVNGISQAEAILDEMLAVHEDYLPQFGDAAHQS